MNSQPANIIYKRHTGGVCVSRSKNVGSPRPKPQLTDKKEAGKQEKTNHTHRPPYPPYINNNNQRTVPTNRTNEGWYSGKVGRFYGGAC